MNRTAHTCTVTTARRLGSAFGLAALALTTVGISTARAESSDITYQCAIVPRHSIYDSAGDYVGPGEPLSEPHPMTAKFDSPLKDGAKAPVGTWVQIAPIESTYTLSPALVDELLAYVDGKMAKGTINLRMTGYIGNVRLRSETMVEGLGYALKAGSPLTLKGDGAAINDTPGSFELREGPHDFLAHEVYAALDNGDSLAAYLSCLPNRDAGILIDLVTGIETAEPARPVVVQTDAEQPSDDVGMPSALVSGAALVSAAALLVLARAGRARRLGSRH